jgi:hypothetical protein
MELERHERKLLARLDRISEYALDFSVAANLACLTEKERMYLEGLISALWQSWNHFCREVVVSSATGCTTAGNVALAPSVTPQTWERVSYIAMQAKLRSPIVAGRTNSVLRYEPTWGDVLRLANLISAIGPANRTQLLSAFGQGVKILHLQKVRNAVAHRNGETMSELLSFRHAYNLQRLPRHPVEVACWVDASSGDYAIEAWSFEMRTIANLAVQ